DLPRGIEVGLEKEALEAGAVRVAGDAGHFASRGRAPALFSAALEDQTCPPSTVFAAFNAWAAQDKAIEVYDFNDHEGGGPYQEAAKVHWLRSYA
ncbi:acetylxylan esterase, partial [Streptomyces sp. NPDC002920]